MKTGKHAGNKAKHAKKGHQTGGRTQRRSKLRIIAAAVLLLAIFLLVLKVVLFIGSISTDHLSDEGYSHDERFAGFVVVNGIDVSVYQNEINWKKVKSSEADFAFIRAAYRKSDTGELFEDENFRNNIKGANNAGVMAGAYIFSQALSEAEAREEADYLADLADRYDIDMPLAIDYEMIQGGRLQAAISDGELFAASMFHDIVLAFCREVEARGYESAVYANYDMLTNNMDASLLDDDAVIWAAHYAERCGLSADYSFWQCSESETIDGIEGTVDHDFWYIEPGRVYETRAKAKKNSVSIGDCEIAFGGKSCRLKNHRAVPKVTVTYDGRKLKKGRHYELSFVHNTQKGTGYAVVRGIKKYKDWTAVPFDIE